MPYDPRRAAEHLADAVASVGEAPPGGWPENAPAGELVRSPAAARVGALAAAEGLALHHTEWRHHLDLPADWIPEHAPELARAPAWQGGVLPERKYQAFRHDQALGGYHPGMRAKWTAHELCHALVGFGWRADAPPLFLATAARLAELLPVVLWYFLDEAHLRRCPRHVDTGPLYGRLCPDCEALAAARVDALRAEAWLEQGRRFLEAELLAIGRTRALGTPVPHVHGSLDLCSDGVAHAAAHGPRLHSEAFRRWIDGFAIPQGGWWDHLDALEARVLAVGDAIATGAPLAPLAPTRVHGRVRWVLQDLGARLLDLWHETEGEAARVLLDLVEPLARACQATAGTEPSGPVLDRARAAIRGALEGYRALHEDWVLPDPDALFSLGVDLLGVHPGRSRAQVEEGVVSAVPLTADLLGETLPDRVTSFLARDTAVRVPLGERFAAWLAHAVGGPLSDLTRYEAALVHLPGPDPDVVGLGTDALDGRYRLARGARILRAGVDVVELARSVDFGDVVRTGDTLEDVDGAPVPGRPTALALRRGPDGHPVILDLSEADATAVEALGAGAVPGLAEGPLEALRTHGILAPVRWAVG